ncbi:unnamed protein product (macronuclear) [Paramecium tetraurelia]|uniref:Uncharacterized protein n=1 Tax=Paramecium tetraurelia TaxID=5888 RepID=A0EIG7_PARTE|nr:uncharacterized protein GSPATT00027437001 [Paramecium tetraurelia]CAK95108.1 unnamed protein product [Paramecium tetraurelia]|eukprot:XP_001462481.1 hypothetical protein (macronuclear) [Paramecium tetraurelia strain d4-2]
MKSQEQWLLYLMDDILTQYILAKDQQKLITQFDRSDDKQREKDYLTEYYQKVGIKSIIFASHEDSRETLCNLFDSEMKDSQPQKMIPTESELLSLQNCYDEVLQLELQEIYNCFVQYSSKLLKGLPVMNDQQKVQLVKEIIKKLINKSYDEFKSLVKYRGNDEQQFLLFQDFKRFTIGTLNESVHDLKLNNIELENFTQNELNTFEKNFEVGRQICLKKIKENAKQQKINYL